MTRLAPLLLIVTALVLAPAAMAGQSEEARHNVVVVMTDDQDFRSMGVMPKTRKLVGRRGTIFETSVVNFPLCCPSRATFMTGQYAHNHGVQWNNAPQGGYYKLKQAETLPVWLRRAGYRTIHIGKFLNETGEKDPTEVPKGWDEWHGGVDPSTYDYYGYTLNHNGVLKTYGNDEEDYSTDVYADIAVQQIRAATKAGKPFFLNVAPLAPHTEAAATEARIEGTPALPAPRHANVFATEEMPRYPNFNDPDISDKPSIEQFFPEPMTEDQIASLQDHWRGRMGSLLAVDDLVQRVSKELKRRGVWDDTDIVFTSDNGWILGEHRLRDPISADGRAVGVKYVPFEGSSRVPLMAAGPDFPAGKVVKGIVTNADLAPTILDIAGARARLPQDGRSLVPVARRPALLNDRAVLIETFENPRGVSPYKAIRTQRWRYEKADVGFEGLFDLKRDPWELQSLHDDPDYDEIKSALKRALTKLVDCKGRGCRVEVEVPQP